MKENLPGYLQLTLSFKKDKILNVWEAECVELGTATSADTIEQAHEEIIDMVILHLETLEKVGERDRFFKEHNIKIHKKRPKPSRKVDVPNENGVLISSLVHRLDSNYALTTG